eukprot:scaffold48325_cov15-Tisochrysis_lutea.AAC.1
MKEKETYWHEEVWVPLTRKVKIEKAGGDLEGYQQHMAPGSTFAFKFLESRSDSHELKAMHFFALKPSFKFIAHKVSLCAQMLDDTINWWWLLHSSPFGLGVRETNGSLRQCAFFSYVDAESVLIAVRRPTLSCLFL